MSTLTPVTTFSAERQHFADHTGNTLCGTDAVYAQADIAFLAGQGSWPAVPEVAALPVCKGCAAVAS